MLAAVQREDGRQRFVNCGRNHVASLWLHDGRAANLADLQPLVNQPNGGDEALARSCDRQTEKGGASIWYAPSGQTIVTPASSRSGALKVHC